MLQTESLSESPEEPVNPEDIQACWGFFLAEALVRIGLGAFAIVMPPFLLPSDLSHLYGGLMLIAAVVGLIRAFRAKNLSGFLPAMIAGVFTLVFGLILLVYPPEPVIDLRAMLVLYLLIEGASQLTFAYQFRQHRHAAGMYFSGFLAIMMALILGLGWPPPQAFWQSSTLVGLLYMLQGFILLAIALGMEKVLKNLARSKAQRPAASEATPDYPGDEPALTVILPDTSH